MAATCANCQVAAEQRLVGEARRRLEEEVTTAPTAGRPPAPSAALRCAASLRADEPHRPLPASRARSLSPTRPPAQPAVSILGAAGGRVGRRAGGRKGTRVLMAGGRPGGPIGQLFDGGELLPARGSAHHRGTRTHTVARSLTLIHSLTRSLTQSFTCPVTHSLTHSLSFTRSLAHSVFHLPRHSLARDRTQSRQRSRGRQRSIAACAVPIGNRPEAAVDYFRRFAASGAARTAGGAARAHVGSDERVHRVCAGRSSWLRATWQRATWQCATRSAQRDSVQHGSVQHGSVQHGSVQRGSVQHAARNMAARNVAACNMAVCNMAACNVAACNTQRAT